MKPTFRAHQSSWSPLGSCARDPGDHFGETVGREVLDPLEDQALDDLVERTEAVLYLEL
jgi:hypothetical protein